jgi:hypothetical protein
VHHHQLHLHLRQHHHQHDQGILHQDTEVVAMVTLTMGVRTSKDLGSWENSD